MICFDVSVNGEQLCRAGVGDVGVLTAILTWVGRSARERQGDDRDGLDLAVGGLVRDHDDGTSHSSWVDELKLAPGDEVLIRIVEDGAPDPPSKVEVTSGRKIREHERRYYEQMKRRFGDE